MTADLDSTFMDADETSAAPTAQAESQDDTELVETHAAPTPELAWSAEADTELIDGGSRGRWVVAVAALLVAIGAVAGASLFLWVHQTTAPTPAASQTPHPSAVPAPPPVAAPPAPAPTSTVAAPATTVAAPPQRTVLPPGNADPNDHSDLFLGMPTGGDLHRFKATTAFLNSLRRYVGGSLTGSNGIHWRRKWSELVLIYRPHKNSSGSALPTCVRPSPRTPPCRADVSHDYR
jgi:hypothetical protein